MVIIAKILKSIKNTSLIAPSLTNPIVGASVDEWGYTLNSNIDAMRQFNIGIIEDSNTQNQELVRLDNEKVSKTEVPDVVEPIIDRFIQDKVVPSIDSHYEEGIKPSITTFVEGKKTELNNHVESVNKPELDRYTEDKKEQIKQHTNNEIQRVVNTTAQKVEEINNYTNEKKEVITTHTSTEINKLTSEGTTQVNRVKAEGEKQFTNLQGVMDGVAQKVNKLEEGKLSKGGYNGTAQDLKGEIDEKYDESTFITVGNNNTNSIYEYEGDVDSPYRAGFYYFGDKSSNRPFNVGGSLLHMPWIKSKNWAKQIYVPDGANYIAIRDLGGNTNVEISHDWKRIPSEELIYSKVCGVDEAIYIQDNVTKEKGKGYIDKVTGGVYICLVTTNDRDVVKGKFELASNIESRYRIAKIEERLGIYYPTYKITSISVSRDEGSTSPLLEYSEM